MTIGRKGAGNMTPGDEAAAFDPSSITRPDSSLLTYYLWVSALTVVGFPFVFIPLFIKYRTLQYHFDDKGVSMSWGLLFKRQIYLTYRRIQDIHVTRNIFHRWLKLAAVAVQTASGSSGAEMTIEGIREPEALRDYLYARMRGARGDGVDEPAESGDDEVLALLHEIRDGVRELAARRGTDA